MRKKVCVIIAILLSITALTCASESDLGVTLEVTYLSRYIWRGLDVYGENHSAIQPSIDVDLYGTGFGVNVFHSRSNGGGAHEDAKEIDYNVSYRNTLFSQQTYAMDYRIGWIYYNYPDTPRKGNPAGIGADVQELYIAFAWPNICPAGIVPSYLYSHIWQSEGGSNCGFRNCGGPAHIFGLSYNLTVPDFLAEAALRVLKLTTHIVYVDGAGTPTADHDFSHAVFGLTTDFDIAEDLTFTPGIYYQSSWDDSINTSDEYWTSLRSVKPVLSSVERTRFLDSAALRSK